MQDMSLLLATGLLSCAGLLGAEESIPPAADPGRPNLYELAGPLASVSYVEDALSGEPARFLYRDNVRQIDAGPAQIRRQQSELGTLVSVTLVDIPDLLYTTFTLTVPDVNLPLSPVAPAPAAESQMFASFGTLSAHRTSIAGPDILIGQIDYYAVRGLTGKASRSTPDLPLSPSSGLVGRVWQGPTCPVEQIGAPPCIAPLPQAAVWLTPRGDGPVPAVVYETLSDARGMFAIEAPPGAYLLHAAPLTDGLFPICPSQDIDIVACEACVQDLRQFARIDCDTGIR